MHEYLVNNALTNLQLTFTAGEWSRPLPTWLAHSEALPSECEAIVTHVLYNGVERGRANPFGPMDGSTWVSTVNNCMCYEAFNVWNNSWMSVCVYTGMYMYIAKYIVHALYETAALFEWWITWYHMITPHCNLQTHCGSSGVQSPLFWHNRSFAPTSW